MPDSSLCPLFPPQVHNKHYVMFVGNTGTGKTAIMMNKLRSMDSEVCSYTTISMNSFSDAPSLQVIRRGAQGCWDPLPPA